MVQVSYPGVYIQEVASGVKTITGVSTSIAGFFGRATMGPVNRPVRCLSLSDFERNFGAPHALSELAASVKLFFDNGGTDCYVVRLAHEPREAAITLENFDGVSVLNIFGKMAGAWGNGLRLEVDYNTSNPNDTFNLRIMQEEGGKVVRSESFTGLSMNHTSPRFAPTFVTQSSDLVRIQLNNSVGDPTDSSAAYNTGTFAGFSQSRRPLGVDLDGVLGTFADLLAPSAPAQPRTTFEISVNESPYVPVVLSGLSTNQVTYPGGISDVATALEGRVNAALSNLVPAQTVNLTLSPLDNQYLITITAATPAKTSVRVRRAPTGDIASALMLGAENGGVEPVRFSDHRPAPTGSVFLIAATDGNLGRLNAIATLSQRPNDLTQIKLDDVVIPLNLNTTAPANDAWFHDNIPGDSPSDHNDGVREKLRLVAQAITDSPASRYRAEVHGYMLVVLAKDGSANQTPTVLINDGVVGAGTSAFDAALHRNVRQYMLGPGTTSADANTPVDGDDGKMPDFGDYVGSESLQTGFYALDGVDLFNLMVLPADREMPDSLRRQLWGPASVYCQRRRAFLIMDAPDSWTSAEGGRPAIVQGSGDVNALRATVVKDHSAVFYPKIRINDRGTITTLGASGALAGLFARTDATRGVWKAPAGTEADLRNLVGLNVKLTDRENGVLNKLGANCLRVFPSGFVSWGARTMEGSDDTPSDYKYIPIRRLALFIEESLYRGTQWVVFEPNDEPLWAKIRLNVGVFMNGLFRQGAFQGSTPNDAFFVKCDKTTTTQADRNLGIVNILVGFAPLKPAEFVVITIQQIAGDLT